MKTLLVVAGILVAGLLTGTADAQNRRFPKHELSINGFRNPSIGLEYRYRQFSLHAGYYPTIISEKEQGQSQTTSFVRTGVSYWFLPIGRREQPSSFYASASWLRGLDRDYRHKNALLAETGFRWMVWQGLNLRIGVAALVSQGRSVKINPTPGVSWSFPLN